MSKNSLLVINPKSGKMQIHKELINIIDLLNKNDYNVDVKITQYKGHATKIIEEIENKDLIICSGGDGTLNEVISGLVKSNKKIPIGYIPSGSTNDFASTIKIPNKVIDATKNIIEGTPYLIDVGQVNNDSCFVYVASFGAFTSVSYNTPQEIKNIFGHLAYIFSGITALSEIKPYYVKYEVNNEKYEGEYLLGLILNTISVGGVLKFSNNDIKLNDGLFEVLFIKNPKNIIEYNQILEGLITSNFSHPIFHYTQTNHINIHLEESISWSLDGEGVKMDKDIEIVNLNNKIEIIT